MKLKDGHNYFRLTFTYHFLLITLYSLLVTFHFPRSPQWKLVWLNP